MESASLIAAPSTCRSFREAVGHGVECKLGPFKCITCVLPVLWSPLAHYLNVVLGISVAGFYMVLTVSPPSWVEDVSIALHFQGGMKHIIMGSLVMINMCIVSRTVAAHSLLHHEDLCNVLDDQTFILSVSDRACFIPWKFGAAFIGVVSVCFMFPTYFVMMTIYMAPWLVLSMAASMPANQVLEDLVDLSRHKIDALCSKLEPRSEARQSVHDEMKESAFWCELTQDYLALDKQLEKIWSLRYGGALLFADCAVRFSLAMVFVWGAASAQQPGTIAFCVAGASATVIAVLMHLYPLAQVTALCQSQRANTKSIIRLAGEFLNHKDLNVEAQAAQSRFLQYIRGTPAGVEVPLLGVITEGILIGYAKAIVTVAPVALTYLLKAFVREGAD